MDFVVECVPRPWPKKEIGKITRKRKSGCGLETIPTLIPKDPDKLFAGYKQNVQTTVKIQMNQCGYKMIEKDVPVLMACHFFLPRPPSGKGATMPYPIVNGGKYHSPDLDNLEYIGNILEKICYVNDVQIVGRPFTPTKNYADETIYKWPVFLNFVVRQGLTNSHIVDYLKQCKQPFTGVFIRVETVT